jgi:DNA-binding response OmpR family regulator
VIYLVNSYARESAILSDLCASQSWPFQVCRTLAVFENRAERHSPDIVVVRSRLLDGHDASGSVRVIVLDYAGSPPSSEARYIKLGADCVLRDPIRPEVLLAYLKKYRLHKPAAPRLLPQSFAFGPVQVFPFEHRLAHGGRSIHVAPREVELLRLLARTPDRVVSYSQLFSDIFSRRFDGDTSNARVLLNLATTSFRRLGLNLRQHVTVFPKSGYMYSTGQASRSESVATHEAIPV